MVREADEVKAVEVVIEIVVAEEAVVVVGVKDLQDKQTQTGKRRLNTAHNCINNLLPFSMNWTTNSQVVVVEPFTEPVRPNTTVTPSVLETFKLFFTATFTSLIAQQTNLYARQVIGDKWSCVTDQEVLAFIGFSILMGINQLPALTDYWRRDPYFRYHPIVDRIRDRFLDLWRFIHFVDNTEMTMSRTDPNYNRLWKIRPILDTILKQCQGNYHPHQQQSIDEAMIKFKGRSSMKQYMPKKKNTKRDFKVWVRADSINGYVCQYEVYTGKQGNNAEVGLGGNVVTRLTRDLVG